jgi:alpha-L-rhamnosidase
VNNAVYIYLMDIIRQMAEVIGEDAIAAAYAERYELTKAEWNATYVEADTGFIGNKGKDTQTGYATPLRFHVIAGDNIDKAVDLLGEAVARAGYTLTTGFSGTPNLLPVLTEHGRVEDAYKLFEQTDYASWLYPVTQGATSVWERWNSYTVEGGFNGNNSMNSFDHFSLGAITQWMMEYQLGIARDEAGFAHFMLQPTPGGTFTNCSGTYESPYGTIGVSWNAAEGKLTSYMVTVPANTQATLYLPIEADVAEALELPEGVVYTGMNQHDASERATFELPAGTFEFTL